MDHRARKWWNRLLGRKSRGDSKDRKESRTGGGAGPGQQPPYKEDSDAENRKPDEVPNGNARKSSSGQTSKSAQVRSKCNPKLAESSNSELSRSQQSGPWRHHLSVSHSGRFKEKRKQRGTVGDRPELYHGPPKPLETDL